MKRIILAASLVFCATTPFAQGNDVPKPQCEPKPEYPGRLAMQSNLRADGFNKDIKRYQECMKKYIGERQAVSKANDDSANAAITEYNNAMKKINEAQEAAKN
jgi:hypothetical protein